MTNENDFDDDTPFVPTTADRIHAITEELFDEYNAIGEFYSELHGSAYDVVDLSEQVAWLDKFITKMKIHRERLALVAVDLDEKGREG